MDLFNSWLIVQIRRWSLSDSFNHSQVWTAPHQSLCFWWKPTKGALCGWEVIHTIQSRSLLCPHRTGSSSVAEICQQKIHSYSFITERIAYGFTESQPRFSVSLHLSRQQCPTPSQAIPILARPLTKLQKWCRQSKSENRILTSIPHWLAYK